MPGEEIPVVIAPEIEPYRGALEALTMQELQAACLSMGFPSAKRKKADLVTILLYHLHFKGKETVFKAGFDSLPRYLSRAVMDAAFQGYVPVKTIAPLADQPILVKDEPSYYRYTNHEEINPNLRLGFFSLYRKSGVELLFLKEPFRYLFSRRLPKPERYGLSPLREELSPGWDTIHTLSESMPLMLEGLGAMLANANSREKILRRGLQKKDLKELRRASAFPEFPIAGKYGADPVNLIARFLMIDPDTFLFSRTKDVRDHIRLILKTFLEDPPSGKVTNYYCALGSNYEFSALATWLSRKPGYVRYDTVDPFPPCRILFRQFLTIAAKSGSWYSVDEVSESTRMQDLPFTLSHYKDFPHEIHMKGDELRLPEGILHSDAWEPFFTPDQFLEYFLIVKPVLKAYCYLMASLGILQIREAEPDKPVTVKGECIPVSPYDGLTYIRITPFGAWCLGVSADKPALAAIEYEAIADKELPLVTYRGKSLECRAFLELVGAPLGGERFRSTEGSFIRGCKDPKEIEKRIGTFKRLICPKPAPTWLRLFDRVRQGARLFHAIEECVMIRLPADQEIRHLFMEDPRISKLVTRAEGGRIVVRSADYGKLRKALAEHGFLDW